MTLEQRHHETFQPLAGLLAILLPGLGYLPLRQPRRAALVAASILLLLLSGLLLGGLDVVNSDAAFWWFLVQCGVGPIVPAIDQLRQALHAAGHIEPALAKVNEVATLAIVMAGMLNIIAIVDCAFHAPPNRRRTPSGTTRAES